MITLPTWLYSKDGKSLIVRTEDELNKKLNEGWKDSPARFKEEQSKNASQNINRGAKK